MARRWRRPWIIKRKGKNGRAFQVVYYDAQRRRRVYDRSFRIERLAKEYARKLELYINGVGPRPDLETALAEEKSAEPPLIRRPWDETTKVWVESGPTRPQTRQTYAILLKRFAEQTGTRYVEDITEETVTTFLVGLRNKGRSLATAAAYLRVLAAFFRSVRPTDCPVTKQIIASWKPYKHRKRERPHYYTDDEYQRILKACDGLKSRKGQRDGLWWKTFITLLHDCGVRMNEAAHLIWRDIDFEAAELRIAPHVNLKGVFPWRPKGKGLRTLPISPELLDLLTRLRAAQPVGIPYVFLGQARYAELLRKGLAPGVDILNCIRKGFVDIRTKACIDEGTVHDMRRTFITNWLRKPEMSPEEVQLLAGHEDIMTTLKVYSEVNEADVVSKAKRLLQKSKDSVLTIASTTAAS